MPRDDVSALVAEAAADVPDRQALDDLRADVVRAVPPLPDPEKLAVLLYASGTSDRPRAAMLSHRALLADLDQVAAVGPSMMHGLIDDEACSVVPIAPPVFARWLPDEHLRERLGPVRLVLSGSAPLEPAVIEQFPSITSIPVHRGDGLAEASPVVTSTLCSREPRVGSVGAALPGIELRLVDGSRGQAEGGDPGEIQVRGASLFSGYWFDGCDGPDDDGWYGTGDLRFLDPSGDLFLVDRVGELVVVSGSNVYPTEVEDVLREVHGVADAAVVGVPDETTGEAVVAYVLASSGADSAPADPEHAVRTHVERRLRGLERRRTEGVRG